MKKFYIAIALIILAIVVAAFAIVFMQKPESGTTDATDPFNFTAGTASTTNFDSGIALNLSDGKTVTVANFVPANQSEGADALNGYQVTEESGQGYSILFYPDSSGFLISLTEEPLGETRRAAQNFLKSKTNLSESELCRVNAQVFTSIDVSETYAGMDLGLSFCDGAVTLPQ